MTVKYEINLMESERGWGQDYWAERFDTYEEAAGRIAEVNSKNTAATAPDYYITAFADIKAVEVP